MIWFSVYFRNKKKTFDLLLLNKFLVLMSKNVMLPDRKYLGKQINDN